MRRLVPPPVVVAAAAVIVAATALVATPGAPVAHAATVPSGFTDTLVATATRPTAVETLPDGRLVVLEQAGRVRVAYPGQPFATALDLTSAICSNSERGMLGFTSDPGFLSNGYVYLFTTRVAPGTPGDCVNRVSRFTMAGGAIDPASELVLLDGISSVNGNHNGGDLDVGSDGSLYVSTGDAGRDPRGDSGSAGANDAAQDLSLLNGKILRITRDGQPAPGNPLLTTPGSTRCATRGNTASTPTSVCQEIWAWGLRNPYRFAFDPNTGTDRVFANDVGQNAVEEVDQITGGANYGWNVCEGPCAPGVAAQNGFTEPLTSYPHSTGTYVTAGAFVPNGQWPASMDGAYLFADGGAGKIFLRTAAGTVDYGNPWATGVPALADMVFGFDELGRTALYYTLSGSGQVRRITWDGQGAAPTPSNLAYGAVLPFRAFDSRYAGTGSLRSDTSRLIQLPAPANARAALVNVTLTRNASWGYAEAWAPRARRPATSILNVEAPFRDVANTAVVTLDAQGRFLLHVTTGTDVVVDVLGWFTETGGTATAGRFVATPPGRLVDTRSAAGTGLASGATNEYTETSPTTTGRVDVPVKGRLGVPTTGEVESVAVILTVVGESQAGYVAAAAGGSAQPQSSNVNASGNGDIRANLAIVPLGADGSISIWRERVADVIVDVVGWFTSSSAAPSASGLFTSLAPVRVYDERGPGSPPAPAGGTLTLDLAARGVPATANASAVLQNVTITETTGFDFVTASPAGGTVPVVSNVNAVAAGQTRAALAITQVGTSNGVSYTTFGESKLVVDVFGAFQR